MTPRTRATALTAALVAALAALPVLTAAAPAEAHAAKRITNTQERHAANIEAGRRSGKITYFEGLKLRREQARIAAMKHKFKADDGRLDRYERQTLRKLQVQAARNIRQETRDGYRRWHVLPRVGR